jgi:hypothetical protein
MCELDRRRVLLSDGFISALLFPDDSAGVRRQLISGDNGRLAGARLCAVRKVKG